MHGPIPKGSGENTQVDGIREIQPAHVPPMVILVFCFVKGRADEDVVQGFDPRDVSPLGTHFRIMRTQRT